MKLRAHLWPTNLPEGSAYNVTKHSWGRALGAMNKYKSVLTTLTASKKTKILREADSPHLTRICHSHILPMLSVRPRRNCSSECQVKEQNNYSLENWRESSWVANSDDRKEAVDMRQLLTGGHHCMESQKPFPGHPALNFYADPSRGTHCRWHTIKTDSGCSGPKGSEPHCLPHLPRKGCSEIKKT